MSGRPLTVDELRFVFDSGYTIRSRWISPVEGVEYRVYTMGGEKVLGYRKSERAAFNLVKKLVSAAAQVAQRGPGEAGARSARKGKP